MKNYPVLKHPTKKRKYPTSWTIFFSGMGQTEFGILDLDTRKLLESEMLTLLGITHVPDNAAHKVNQM